MLKQGGEAVEIHESAEDYLESILMIQEKMGMVYSIDIVNKTSYSKPSISVAMKNLRENGYIQMDQKRYITLTKSEIKIARRIYTRHRILTKLLVSLNPDEQTAVADACRLEHAEKEHKEFFRRQWLAEAN